jgi:hypothetical protein
MNQGPIWDQFMKKTEVKNLLLLFLKGNSKDVSLFL